MTTKFNVTLHEDGDEKVIATGETEAAAVLAASEFLACSFGPLSLRATDKFAILADRVQNAFGGDACISLDSINHLEEMPVKTQANPVKADVRKAKAFIKKVFGIDSKFVWSKPSAVLFSHEFGGKVPMQSLLDKARTTLGPSVTFSEQKKFGVTGAIEFEFDNHLVRLCRYKGESMVDILLVDSPASTWFNSI